MIEHLDDDVARRTMQEIADSYEQLARRAEQELDPAQTKR